MDQRCCGKDVKRVTILKWLAHRRFNVIDMYGLGLFAMYFNRTWWAIAPLIIALIISTILEVYVDDTRLRSNRTRHH